MDVYCPRCGDPFDNDELHSAAEERGISYDAVASDFRARGCEALSYPCSTNTDARMAAIAVEIYAAYGGDMDAAASAFSELT